MRTLKIFFAVLLFFHISFCGNLISDFAPFNTGDKWLYSYYYHRSQVGTVTEVDSFLVSIELSSKPIEDDTFILLKVRECGVSFGGEPTFWNRHTIDTSFIDTVIVSGASIYKSNSYRSKVFPFWNSHTISSDSLHRGILGNDSVYYQYSQNSYFSSSLYLQNVGLYSSGKSGGGVMTLDNEYIRLISFNNNSVALGVKERFTINRKKETVKTFKLLPDIQLHSFDEIYSLDGKKITGDKLRKTRAILIEKQSQ